MVVAKSGGPSRCETAQQEMSKTMLAHEVSRDLVSGLGRVMVSPSIRVAVFLGSRKSVGDRNTRSVYQGY